MGAGCRPFLAEHAVHDGVAHGAVAAQGMVAQHAVPAGAEPFDGLLAGRVEDVGAPSHGGSSQRIEGVGKQHELAARVDMAALDAAGVPGVADLQPPDVAQDAVVARGAQHAPAGLVDHGKGQALSCGLHAQRRGDVAGLISRSRHTGHPQLPERAIGGSCGQSRGMRGGERFEPDALQAQGDWNGIDGAGLGHGRSEKNGRGPVPGLRPGRCGS